MADRTVRLIGLDWGTSSLRAYRMGPAGAVQEERHRPWGITQLPPAADGRPDASPDAAFERALEDICGDWLSADPALPLLACGMVGSAQGWREAAYLDTPLTLGALAQGLTRVPCGPKRLLHIVPGLIQRGPLPNVMRGEETQVLGALAQGAWTDEDGACLIGLPGTHSKWVTVRQRQIQGFLTYMTGDVFAALKGHTLLGRTMVSAPPDNDAFLRGLAVTQATSPGLLSDIFSTRALGLTGELAPTAQADYLSGLLIGHEVAGLVRTLGGGRPTRIVLCGEPDLCRRYTLALESCGLGTPSLVPNASACGLWQIATLAGLTRPNPP